MNKPRTRKTNPLNNLNQTQYLTELIKNEPNLETTKPKTDKTIWFRYKHNNIHEQDLEGINRMILYELWKNGQENINEDTINGKYTLKTHITQHKKHLDYNILIEQITTMGNIFAKQYTQENTPPEKTN